MASSPRLLNPYYLYIRTDIRSTPHPSVRYDECLVTPGKLPLMLVALAYGTHVYIQSAVSPKRTLEHRKHVGATSPVSCLQRLGGEGTGWGEVP
jgi:hypothetical protein